MALGSITVNTISCSSSRYVIFQFNPFSIWTQSSYSTVVFHLFNWWTWFYWFFESLVQTMFPTAFLKVKKATHLTWTLTVITTILPKKRTVHIKLQNSTCFPFFYSPFFSASKIIVSVLPKTILESTFNKKIIIILVYLWKPRQHPLMQLQTPIPRENRRSNLNKPKKIQKSVQFHPPS